MIGNFRVVCERIEYDGETEGGAFATVATYSGEELVGQRTLQIGEHEAVQDHLRALVTLVEEIHARAIGVFTEDESDPASLFQGPGRTTY